MSVANTPSVQCTVIPNLVLNNNSKQWTANIKIKKKQRKGKVCNSFYILLHVSSDFDHLIGHANISAIYSALTVLSFYVMYRH